MKSVGQLTQVFKDVFNGPDNLPQPGEKLGKNRIHGQYFVVQNNAQRPIHDVPELNTIQRMS